MGSVIYKIPQFAVYATYSPCLLGGYMLPSPPFIKKNQKQPLIETHHCIIVFLMFARFIIFWIFFCRPSLLVCDEWLNVSRSQNKKNSVQLPSGTKTAPPKNLKPTHLKFDIDTNKMMVWATYWLMLGIYSSNFFGFGTSPFTPNFLAWWNKRLHGEDSQIPEGLQRYNPSNLKDGILLGGGPYLEDHPS